MPDLFVHVVRAGDKKPLISHSVECQSLAKTAKHVSQAIKDHPFWQEEGVSCIMKKHEVTFIVDPRTLNEESKNMINGVIVSILEDLPKGM